MTTTTTNCYSAGNQPEAASLLSPRASLGIPKYDAQKCQFSWGCGPLSKTWFLGPPLVHVPNRISTGSAAVAQPAHARVQQTDKHTDTPQHVQQQFASYRLHCDAA